MHNFTHCKNQYFIRYFLRQIAPFRAKSRHETFFSINRSYIYRVYKRIDTLILIRTPKYKHDFFNGNHAPNRRSVPPCKSPIQKRNSRRNGIQHPHLPATPERSRGADTPRTDQSRITAGNFSETGMEPRLTAIFVNNRLPHHRPGCQRRPAKGRLPAG